MSHPLPAQIRAARALLDWSMLDLAQAARVSVSTVHRYESDKERSADDDVVALMQNALETEGVRFLSDDENGPGVHYKRH